MAKPQHPITFLPSDINVVKNRCCDISKAREYLDYRPRYGLEKGLQETVDWWMTNKR
jgi:sterol-4alpha-carboxylate 3-dehydrogenase (decarboxylating)